MDEKQKLNQLENFVAVHEMLKQNINKRLSLVENVGTIMGIQSLISAGAIVTMIILLISKGIF